MDGEKYVALCNGVNRRALVSLNLTITDWTILTAMIHNANANLTHPHPGINTMFKKRGKGMAKAIDRAIARIQDEQKKRNAIRTEIMAHEHDAYSVRFKVNDAPTELIPVYDNDES